KRHLTAFGVGQFSMQILGQDSVQINMRGYEIPLATWSNRCFYGLWLFAPTFALVLSIYFARSAVSASLAWFLIAIGIFHIRNVVVRKEVDEGLHDSLYGPHLMRMRQREFDERLPWFRKALFSAVAMVVVAGVVLHIVGIDVVSSLAAFHASLVTKN
ncbi:hypothetical protein DEE91_13795, partial [Ralstonia pickettii]|nr:hypothetical protein [Ralstonia insidiosa]MBX3772823.1 hypothetical protein [Ralstonia pickettii]MBA9968894.1 hypothetical protein [Ralstonia insidiosa]MBX3811614.1 hypothetical protein [Ralstonia pickettii]MBX3817748.1 hypothetical protein [Ralstonia insidiosa]